MSALPKISIKDLLEAGVHFGHKSMRWNPRMAPYLFGVRNGIHIIDLQQTAPLLHNALQLVQDVVKKNGRVLFVGTKRQASEVVSDEAQRCGQYYVNHRWLGGMMTNWGTVSKSINTLNSIEANIANPASGLKKKELLKMQKKASKLRLTLGGIMEMGGKPDLLFIVDTNRESIALKEAKTLGIPVIAILDSNSDPSEVDFPVPGNDDSTRAIRLYCRLISDAVLSGIAQSLNAAPAPKPEKATAETKVEVIAQEPAAEKAPAEKVEKPAAKKAATKEAAEKKPAAKKEPAKKPAAKKAATKKPAAKAEKAEEKKPAKKPAAKKTAAKKPAAKKKADTDAA